MKSKKSKPSFVESFKSIFEASPKDVEAAIKKDHEALRNFLKVLKDTDEDMAKRRRAYALFSDLLKSHSDVEEDVVYLTAQKLPGREMKIKIAEGYVEHHLASDLMKRIDRVRDATTWSAHANVLSEIVEHHLREEERDLLPLIRKATSIKTEEKMLAKYVAQRRKTQKRVTAKNSGVLKTSSESRKKI